MHPPGAVCKALYDVHPQLRLAWAGRPPKYPGETNPGSYAIVQLYHIQDCGDLDDTMVTFREFWDTTIRPNAHGQAERVRITRGPIFNKNGGTERDWDPLVRIPVFVMTIDEEYEYPDGSNFRGIEDVHSGKYLVAIKAYLAKDIKTRAIESGIEKGKTVARKIDEIGRDGADYLWHEANKTGETSDTSITYESTRHQLARLDRQNEMMKDEVRDMFLPPK